MRCRRGHMPDAAPVHCLLVKPCHARGHGTGGRWPHKYHAPPMTYRECLARRRFSRGGSRRGKVHGQERTRTLGSLSAPGTLSTLDSLGALGSLSASALGASRHPSAKPAKRGTAVPSPWTRRTHADPTDSLLELIPDQRFEYCGALRAFLRPAFLRSLTRASRVSMPAFFSAGRDASASMALRARATPRRRAPA